MALNVANKLGREELIQLLALKTSFTNDDLSIVHVNLIMSN